MDQVFNAIADAYDRLYDTLEGKVIFSAEPDCLLSLFSGPFDGWLEVGAGTGRFARALRIPTGVDPSPSMLAIAGSRCINACLGRAERLPFAEDSLDGVLMALTLCFVADAPQALRECRRILHPGGLLLLGALPADSAWGREYKEKAVRGHPICTHACLRTATENIDLAQRAGFTLCSTAGTLFWEPDQAPE